jgi:hypothetical protein
VKCCSMRPAARVRMPPCRASTLAARPATRAALPGRPTVAQIGTVMRHADSGLHAARLRALIMVLSAQACGSTRRSPSASDPRRGSLLVRLAKGGRRREVGMDDWAWEQLQPPCLTARGDLPVGPMLCIATGPTRGRAWSAGAARTELRHAAAQVALRHPATRSQDVEPATRARP